MSSSERLVELPSAGLVTEPTPFHRLGRFGDAVGADIWIKRDDVGPVAFAGNKIRKYDLVLGHALTDGCDTLVTTGAVQSNSARAGAAAAAATGLSCVLLYSGSPPLTVEANHLLSVLLGAEIRFAGDVGWAELDRGVSAIVDELARRGQRAVAAPVGCSSPLGALGFARAFLELDRQLTHHGVEPAAIVHTSTSGGTHAGLLVGRALTQRRATPLVAVNAATIRPDSATILELAQQAAGLIDFDLDLDQHDVRVTSAQLGPGYAIATPDCLEAMRLLAMTEGILTDPVYSGKGLAEVVAMARRGADGPIVFWHTGGYHALFDPHHGDSARSVY